MKICVGCKESKEEDEFYWKNKEKGIRQPYCKECKSRYNKTWYSIEKNRKAQISRARKNSKKYQTTILQWKIDYIEKRGGCSYEGCDVTHPALIDFDHKNKDEKSFNISEAYKKYRSIEEIEIEAEKCNLLCANHHRLRTVEQFGWYAAFDLPL